MSQHASPTSCRVSHLGQHQSRMGAVPVSAAVRMALGAMLLTAASKLQVPIPATAVPFTLGPQAALLLGALLGPVEGAGAVAAWLSLGISGAPVFASGLVGLPALLAPSGGFALGYLPAAFFVGLARNASRPAALGMWLLASWLILAMGAAGLAITLGASEAYASGVLPFAATDACKASLMFIGWRAWRERFQSR